MADKYCLLYKGTWTEVSEDDYYTYKSAGNSVYIEKNGPCGTSKKSKPAPNPDDNNRKKKKQEEIKPKKTCVSLGGAEYTNSDIIGTDIATSAGLEKFKKFLLKYYEKEVSALENANKGQLLTGTINDCIIILLFNTVDKIRNRAIGNYIWEDWKQHTNNNVLNPSTDEFKKWLASGQNIKTDWQSFVTSGLLSEKGRTIQWNGNEVMVYKMKTKDGDSTGKKIEYVDFDESELDGGTISLNKILSKINYTIKGAREGYPTFFYGYFTYPIENTDEKTKNQAKWIAKRYPFTKTLVNGVAELDSPENLSKWVGLTPKSSSIKEEEVNMKKYILEKIRNKNENSKNLYYEVVTTTTTMEIDVEENKGGDSEDLFGIESVETLNNPDAKKLFIEKSTPLIQNVIDKGALSDYFFKWNELADKYGANTKLKTRKIPPGDTKQEIDATNSFYWMAKGKDYLGQYKSEPFYKFLKLNGDPNKNKATLYTPINVSEVQSYTESFSSPQFCRARLVTYLKTALKKEFVGGEYEAWKKKREICDCNINGGFRNFKLRGKDTKYNKETWRKDRLNIRPKTGEFTTSKTQSYYDPETEKTTAYTVTSELGDESPFVKVFNKNLNWNEISSLLRGDKYTASDGSERNIDSKLIIENFNENGDECRTDAFILKYSEIKEHSLDHKINKKLTESIRNKNKKEVLVENVLKKLLGKL